MNKIMKATKITNKIDIEKKYKKEKLSKADRFKRKYHLAKRTPQ